MKDIEEWLGKYIKPLLPIKTTHTELGHIESVSCGALTVSNWNIGEFFRNSFSLVFMSDYVEEEVNPLNLSEELKNALFDKTPDGRFRCKITNISRLEKYLKEKSVPDNQISQIVIFYKNHIPNTDVVLSKIKEFPIGKQLIETCSYGSDMSSLQLTPIGLAIALTYLECMMNIELDVDIWIN